MLLSFSTCRIYVDLVNSVSKCFFVTNLHGIKGFKLLKHVSIKMNILPKVFSFTERKIDDQQKKVDHHINETNA